MSGLEHIQIVGKEEEHLQYLRSSQKTAGYRPERKRQDLLRGFFETVGVHVELFLGF